MTGTFDLLLAAESLIPPRTGIGNYTWNLYRELLLRPEIGRVVLMAGLRQIDQVPDQAANAAMADATSSPPHLCGGWLTSRGWPWPPGVRFIVGACVWRSRRRDQWVSFRRGVTPYITNPT